MALSPSVIDGWEQDCAHGGLGKGREDGRGQRAVTWHVAVKAPTRAAAVG